jgi:hypothetical protein
MAQLENGVGRLSQAAHLPRLECGWHSGTSCFRTEDRDAENTPRRFLLGS